MQAQVSPAPPAAGPVSKTAADGGDEPAEAPYFTKLAQQVAVLTAKNLKLQLRNRVATVAQLGIGVLFILALLVMDAAISANKSYNENFVDSRTTTPVDTGLLRCSTNGPDGPSCFTFVYAPSGSACSDCDAIAAHVAEMAGLPGADEPFGYTGFVSASAVDEWILGNPNRTAIAVIFEPSSLTAAAPSFQYTLQFNETRICRELGVFGCVDLRAQQRAPMQSLVDSALIRQYGSNVPDAKIQIQVANFPHPDLAVSIDVVQAYGESFFYMVLMFSFVVQASLVVTEKELKLPQAMKQMGMLDLSYWISWQLCFLITNTIMITFFYLCGLMFQLEFFLENAFGLTYTFFWLSTLGLTGMALLFSALTHKAATVRNLAMVWFIFTYLFTNLVTALVFTSARDKPENTYRSIFSWLANVNYYGGFQWLVAGSAGATQTGRQFSDRLMNILPSDPRYDTEWTFEDYLVKLILCWLVYSLLAWYLDNILPNVYGYRENPIFCLLPKFWTGAEQEVPNIPIQIDTGPQPQQMQMQVSVPEGVAPGAVMQVQTATGVMQVTVPPGAASGSTFVISVPAPAQSQMDPDVLAEAKAVQADEFPGREIAVKIRGLGKLFRAPLCQCCCTWNCRYCGFACDQSAGRCEGCGFKFTSCRPKKDFQAVNNISYAIDKGSCFVLLGHNGAGKTTTINMLTGNVPVTTGDAFVFGRSVRTQMKTINRFMGVCPQHDVLWEQLTAREHLAMFAKLKGMSPEKVDEEVNARLKDVLLEDVGDVQAGTFSGGMKRRLSIAIALLGNPRIVYLDEPTTGMDPVTRREVWDMIERAKRGRVIVLTTHSMEEADILGDRIAVMSHGRIQAIGSSLRLKNRFGAGYRLSLKVGGADKEALAANVKKVDTFLVEKLPGAKLVHTLDGACLFQLPREASNVEMVAMFKALEAQSDALQLTNLSIGLTTLEEVFLQLSRNEEEAKAKARGASQPIEVKPANPAAAPSNEKPRKVTFTSGFRALFYKSATYQSRQWAQMCCIIFFPVFIMSMLILLEKLLFARFRLEALCGPDVSKEDCQLLGPNLTCMATQFGQTYSQPVSLDVGIIAESYRGGEGVNGNCGVDLHRTDGRMIERPYCFDDLETPDWTRIPIAPGSKAGSLSHTRSDMLEDWYMDLLHLAGINYANCDAAFEFAFDCFDKGDVDIVDTDGTTTTIDCSDLARAQDWKTAQATEGPDTGGSNFGVSSGMCIQQENDAGELTFEPSSAALAAIDILEAQRDACQVDANSAVLQHFARAGLEDEINDARASREATGLLDSFTTSAYCDSEMATLSSQMVQALYSSGAFISIYISTDAEIVAFRESIMAGGATLCSMCTLGCTAPMENCALHSVLESAYGETVSRNMCLYATYLDAVRGVTFEVLSSDDALQGRLYDNWFGTEKTTPFLSRSGGRNNATIATVTSSTGDSSSSVRASADADDLLRPYLWHRYLADFTAYTLSAASPSTAEYAYKAFYNNTGTGGELEGNWIMNQWLMNSALVQQHTNKGITMFKKSWPNQFKCNRDEWLRGEISEAKLDCDLLQGFLGVSILDFIMTGFLPYMLMIYQFVILSLVVYEKQNRLRTIMKMMGLRMSVYWTVTYVFFYMQYVCFIAGMWVLASVANVHAFQIHSPVVLALLFFFWGHLLISHTFLLSTFFSSTRTATAAALLILILSNNIGGQLFSELLNSDDTPSSAFIPYMFWPPWVMLRFVWWICLAGAFKEPITGDNWTEIGDGVLPACMAWCAGETIVSLVLLWYFENTIVVGFGVRQPWNFCLNKRYWLGDGKEGTGAAESLVDAKQLPQPTVPQIVQERGWSMPQDVKLELARITDEAERHPELKVRVAGLHKLYPAGRGNDAKLAVKCLSLGVNENECFGMLGHNGAGKTTAINMLTGLFAPTSGTAVVRDSAGGQSYNIRTELNRIHNIMGVCPQHDVLWGDLSAREHLLFYGRLKGFSGQPLKRMIDQALIDVNLQDFNTMLAGEFSGGMRRRLSCANSLIGNPQLVYLDEPSTGLDPASRHRLWDVLSAAKGNKSIVLTTHSMEEADKLCDRLCIMADGEVQCIGSAPTLKWRFGKGYTCVIATADKSDAMYDRVDKFVHELFPTAKLLNTPLNGTSKYEVAREEVVLSTVFERMEQAKQELGIVDWGFTETTLEEVFLKLAHLSHVETHSLQRTLSDLARNGLDGAEVIEEKTQSKVSG